MNQIVDVLHKFAHPHVTAKGARRASVRLSALQTLWFNTGTLCNITCTNCYIESSPKNDRLAYLTLSDVARTLDEARERGDPVKLVGFTGGEPFMNPDIINILHDTLGRGLEALVLTNAMRPLIRHRKAIIALQERYGAALRVRVSLDAPKREMHDQERGAGSFKKALEGLRLLKDAKVGIEIAGRMFHGMTEFDARREYAALFEELGLEIDAYCQTQLVMFPEMTSEADPPEITEACWGILHKSPNDIMCATARMIVRRKGAASTSVVACTLLPYDTRFELGPNLNEASQEVLLNHPYCATFCVLGGSTCGASKC